MVSTLNNKDENTSDFFITCNDIGSDLSRFDDKRTIFGQVAENFDLIR